MVRAEDHAARLPGCARGRSGTAGSRGGRTAAATARTSQYTSGLTPLLARARVSPRPLRGSGCCFTLSLPAARAVTVRAMASTATDRPRRARRARPPRRVWAAQQPLDQRVFGVPYDDAELLGRWVVHSRPLAAGRPRPASGERGAVRRRLRGRGPVAPGSRRAARALAGLAEHLATWPGTAVVDRVHPARRELPRLWGSGRAFAQATWRHLLFGLLLGELERRLNPPSEQLPWTTRPSSTNGHGSVEHLVAPALAPAGGLRPARRSPGQALVASGFAGSALAAACREAGEEVDRALAAGAGPGRRRRTRRAPSRGPARASRQLLPRSTPSSARERHSGRPRRRCPRMCHDSCASTSTAIAVSRPWRPPAIAVRPMHSSSFARRPSASASSSSARLRAVFVSSSGVPSASNRTLPSTMSQPSRRPAGPGQWTPTGRPAICDAIALQPALVADAGPSARRSTRLAAVRSSAATVMRTHERCGAQGARTSHDGYRRAPPRA